MRAQAVVRRENIVRVHLLQWQLPPAHLSGTQAMEIIKDSLLEISEVSANTRISAQNKRKKQRKTQIYHLVENQYNLVFWARVVQFMSLERCKSVQNL